MARFYYRLLGPPHQRRFLKPASLKTMVHFRDAVNNAWEQFPLSYERRRPFKLELSLTRRRFALEHSPSRESSVAT